jgi:hypothetical protein
MIRLIFGLLAMFGVAVAVAPTTYAESTLGVQPLQYTESLQKGERKKAFIDVTNPAFQTVTVQFSVQGFKQIDSKGTLSFYDDPKLKEGVLLDYQEKEIPAGKTLRLFFIVDGSKLPTGDVFAAVFAQTKPDERASVPAVRIGTLLILTNDTPGARDAEVVSFTTPIFNFGTAITGEVKIKNTAPVNTSSGFTPKVDVRMWPFGFEKTLTGPLVFAGNTRTIALDQPGSYFGIYKISVSHGASQKYHWVVLATGVWRWVTLGVIALFLAVIFLYVYPHIGRRSKRS